MACLKNILICSGCEKPGKEEQRRSMTEKIEVLVRREFKWGNKGKCISQIDVLFRINEKGKVVIDVGGLTNYSKQKLSASLKCCQR